MKREDRVLASVLATALVLAAFGTGVRAQASPEAASPDPMAMTVDELEAYIAAQQAELEKALVSRDRARAQTEELGERLAAQQQRQDDLRAELETLCRSQDELKPGSFDDCVSGIE